MKVSAQPLSPRPPSSRGSGRRTWGCARRVTAMPGAWRVAPLPRGTHAGETATPPGAGGGEGKRHAVASGQRPGHVGEGVAGAAQAGAGIRGRRRRAGLRRAGGADRVAVQVALVVAVDEARDGGRQRRVGEAVLPRLVRGGDGERRCGAGEVAHLVDEGVVGTGQPGAGDRVGRRADGAAGDGGSAQPVPAAHQHSCPQDLVARRVAAGGELAHLALLRGIDDGTSQQPLRHGSMLLAHRHSQHNSYRD